MFRWRRWQRASALLCLALTAAATGAQVKAGGPTAAAAGPGEVLVLAAVLDGRVADEPVAVERRGPDILLRVADARRLGMATPRDAAPDAMVSTATLGLRATIDVATQTLAIETPGRDRARIGLSAARAPPPPPTTPNGWGGIVSYDLSAIAADRTVGAGGELNAVMFAPAGYGVAGAIVSAGARRRAHVRRTDTGFTFAAPDRLISATVGDVVNAASSDSRPIRMGGVRIGTDFSLRPDLVTFPLPTIAAGAGVPTAVDVIVNGNRQQFGDVRGDPAALTALPVQTGVNSISVTTRDALGRTTVQSVTTYTSRALLSSGLGAWSAELGRVRTGYLTPDDRYRQLAGSGTVRYGVSDGLTAEVHGEATGTVFSGGLGGSLGLGPLGLLTGSASLGRDYERRNAGAAFAVAIERIARPVSFSARYTRAGRYWTDIASQYGSSIRNHALILNIGLDLTRFGTFGIGLIDLGTGEQTRDFSGRRLASPLKIAPSTLLNMTYSRRLADRVGLIATAAFDTRTRRQAYLSIGAALLFGSRTSGFVGATREGGRGGAAASVAQTAIEQGQWGFRAAASTGGVDRVGAGVSYLGRDGYVEALAESVAGHASGQLSARGALGIAGGRVFTANAITDSFAVIDAGGQPHVPIYQDNRRIGDTNAAGFLIAPHLAGYESAKFSIDPMDIDATLHVDRTEATVRPARRAGVTVSFGLRSEIARTYLVVDDDGAPLPPGARAAIGDIMYPIGIGGVLFAPRPVGTMMVTTPDGRTCHATAPRDSRIDTAPLPLRCLANGPRPKRPSAPMPPSTIASAASP